MPTFSPQGQNEFNATVQKFKQDLEREADRLEGGTNAGEITYHHVQTAELLVRQGLSKPPRDKWDVVSILGTPAGGIAVGWATNNLSSLGGVITMIAGVVLIFGCESIKLVKGN